MSKDQNQEACSHYGLSQNKVGAVSLCPSCGVLRLSIAHVSIRLEPEDFDQLTQLMVSAQAHLEYLADAHEASLAGSNVEAARNMH